VSGYASLAPAGFRYAAARMFGAVSDQGRFFILPSLSLIAVTAHSRVQCEHELTRFPSEAHPRLLVLLGGRYDARSDRPTWTSALPLARIRMPRLAAAGTEATHAAARFFPRPLGSWHNGSNRRQKVRLFSLRAKST